jgi:DNA-binding CsgD family transcriptional regulator
MVGERPDHTLQALAPGEARHDLVALDDALVALAAVHPRKSEVVERRFFGGLSLEETVEALHISVDTVSATRRAAAEVRASRRTRWNRGVNPDLERTLRNLEDAANFVKTYRFDLSDDYLSLIDAVEAMPRNQSGADKSGRWLGSRAYARSLAAKVTRSTPDQ